MTCFHETPFRGARRSTLAIFARSLLLAAALPILAAPVIAASDAGSVLPAFPGAEGAGANVRGGRGGRVLEVTNLADRGPGTFRAAVEAAGPRIVVFRVSGIIDLASPVVIEHPYLTVAGQTAPGDGICIRGDTTTINAPEVVIRYVRFLRGNPESRDDALDVVRFPGRIIVDHCSFGWELDASVRPGAPARENGIVRTPEDAAGWPACHSLPPPVDLDHDGMPDAWERRHGFEVGNPADGVADPDKDGYTNLEEFLNGTDPREFVDYTKPENNVNSL